MQRHNAYGRQFFVLVHEYFGSTGGEASNDARRGYPSAPFDPLPHTGWVPNTIRADFYCYINYK
jgi:hypothetical protein